MFKCVLIADDVQLDLYDNLPLSVNLSIAEIQDFSKRNGDFSKTIKLPGTKINNAFFEHTYDVNIKTANFNPNVKVPASFREGGDSPLKGDLRLLSIDVKVVNGIEDITYDIVILGRNDTLFKAIGDDKLEDLDLSTYNHPFTYAKQNACESDTVDIAATPTVVGNGVGYRYPVVDYGFNGFASNFYKVDWLRPAIFAWTYLQAIFLAAGKTYKSQFLDDVNDLFMRELILHNGEKLTISAATQANYEFYAGMTATSSVKTFPLYYTNTNNWSTIKTTPTTFLFNDVINNLTFCVLDDDSTLPFIDTGAIYDNTTGIWVVANTANYQIIGTIKAEIKLNLPAGATTSTNSNIAYACKVARSTDGGSTWTMDYYDFFNDSTVLTTSYQTISHNLAIPNKTYNQGDWIRIEFHPIVNWSASGINFLNVSTPVTSGTPTLDWKLNSASILNFKLVSNEIQEGSNLVINDCIPRDIKQKDFLLHFIKKYNLYVDVDKEDPNNYIIEPRDEPTTGFYATGVELDWTEKWAVDKDITIKPMGDIDWKRFIQSYKPDQDYYNKVYQENYQQSYGTHTEILSNDFNTKDLKDELIFSPTPVVDNPYNDLIIPKIFSFDGTTVKPIKHNIRTVLWRGSVAMTNTWTYGSTSGNVTKSSYQGCAMVDDPLASTESIEFGIPNELFYSGIATTYTNNNLFNRFYSKQISQLTHRDSKTVTKFMKLEPSDIANFDFRDKIWIKDSWYYVNKIMDFNPIKEDLTKVEFLKIVAGDTFTPVSSPVETISTDRLFTGIKMTPFGMPVEASSAMSSSRLSAGTNNNSLTEGTIVTGDNNKIGSESYGSNIIGGESNNIGNESSRVNLINCINCKVGDLCVDVTLENCINMTIDEGVTGFSASFITGETIQNDSDGISKSGNKTTPSKITTATVTANFNVDPNIDLYYVDCSGANILATFNMATALDKKITFKRIDGVIANTFSIDDTSGLAAFDGAATPYNTVLLQYGNLKVTTNGANLFSTL